MNNKTTKNNKGFGLLEVIISISVVIIGILPLINLFSSVLTRERDTENKLMAIYFAQEGIEIVRQIRDTNWRKGESWDYEPDSGTTVFGSKWGITLDICNQYRDFKLADASVTANTIIYYNTDEPYAQGCSSGTATNFTRTVLIENKDYTGAVNNDYMKITSTVKLDGAELYSLIAYLNNWQ